MSEPPENPAPKKDYTRQLGVVECFVAITNECERGPVRAVASQALEAIKERGPGVMREQVYYVLTALQGWRGVRARQIHDSLTAFYESSAESGAERPDESASSGESERD